jgi:predicted GIY-YIG superfamily endonuclease
MSDLPGICFDRESIRVLVPQRAWIVYRIYTEDGTLVYAGASGQPRSRLLKHLADPAKRELGALVGLEFHRSSSAMARSEKHMLDTEQPIIPSGFGRRNAAWKARKS